MASKNGHVDVVKFLIKYNANVNQADTPQLTSLYIAVSSGNEELVRLLLQYQADATLCTSAHQSSLLEAIEANDISTIVRLIKAQADVNHAGPVRLGACGVCCGGTALTIAASNGDVTIVDMLLQDGKLGFGGVKFVVERAVYRGKDVAIKSALTRQDTPALLAEADAISSGNSPYVISLVGKTDEADRPHLVVDFMDQGNLRQHLDTKLAGTCTTSGFTTPHVAWVLANALLDLHEKGLVHRDLRSEHVLLSTTEHVKVAHLGGAHTRLMNMSMAELLWTAPEILLGESTSPAADVYAFGVILTELDTLQRPYWDLSLDPWALTDSIRKGVIRPSISSSSPLWFKELVDSCLAFNPIERPSAKTIVEILEKQWRDVPVPVHAVRFPTPSADDTFKGATHTSSGLYDVE
ncbi:hypothetical protein DYB32_006016 [Aphanomyces invadans]|uniref:Protein kinase domain-containing protein n=1 Tax=Aphanomyces invadans TaxID=157072 RepID=A0A3R7CYR8_9STRA|nr:hypothetical protein DYB32_006016 [Aphanomyces invadans]